MKDLGKLEGPIEPFDSLFRWISKGIGIIFCPDTLGGGFKYFLFSHLLREDSQFDSYFSDGLKPPSRCKSRIPFCFWPPLLSKKSTNSISFRLVFATQFAYCMIGLGFAVWSLWHLSAVPGAWRWVESLQQGSRCFYHRELRNKKNMSN